jgi:hypothetical protein
MVLVSIHPFALRRLFLVIVAFLCFSAFCFADPVLMVRQYSSHPGGLASGNWVAPTSQQWQDPREQINLEFTDREAPSVIRTAPSSIFGKAVCAMRPVGPHAGLVAAPPVSAPGEF